MPTGKGDGITHMEGPAQIPQSLGSCQGCLRFRCRHSHQIDRRYRTHEVPSNAVGEEEGLIEFTGMQPRPVEWNRHNDVDVEIRRQGADHQLRQHGCKAIYVSIFKGADGVPERWNIWV